jgi:hypothetical protein
VLTAQILPAEETVSARQQIRSGWNAKVTHAAGQGIGRNTGKTAV